MILLFLGSWRSTLVVDRQHPAVDPVRDHRAARARRDAQRDDARRARARGRRARRRCHRRDREHQPQPSSRSRSTGSCARSCDGAEQVAVPAFVSTLCICIVFAPISFLTGAAKSLFVPLGLAVVFAMLMSYIAVANAVVPTMVRYLLEPRRRRTQPNRFTAAFDRAFDRLRTRYGQFLAWTLVNRGVHGRHLRGLRGRLVRAAARCSAAISSRPSTPASSSCTCAPRRATRIEETEKQILAMERAIRTVIPPERDRHDDRHHRHAVLEHQPVAQRRRADLAGRTRRS